MRRKSIRPDTVMSPPIGNPFALSLSKGRVHRHPNRAPTPTVTPIEAPLPLSFRSERSGERNPKRPVAKTPGTSQPRKPVRNKCKAKGSSNFFLSLLGKSLPRILLNRLHRGL